MPAKYAPTSRGGLRKVLSQTKRNIARRRRYVETGRKPGRPKKYFNTRRYGHHARLISSRGASEHARRWLY